MTPALHRAARCGAAALALAAPAVLLAAPGSALPAALPFRHQPDPSVSGVGLAAAFAVALFAVGAWSWRMRRDKARRGAGRPAAPAWLGLLGRAGAGDETISLIASKPLGPGVRLHVVQWAGQQYLLSNQGAAVTVLDRRALHQGPAPLVEGLQ
jgi:hypothetical protein